jgi:type I restriction enzyme, S subunit
MSFPRYPKYKDSGVPWLGAVPAHWSLPKLKQIATFSGGGTPSRENPDYWSGDIPWVSPKDMKAERLTGAEELITSAGLASSSANLVPANRLLMVVRSGILKHTIPVAINQIDVALNQDMKALDFGDEGVTSSFFLRWVQGLNDLLLLEWAKQGATVESIEHEYLANTVVPLPTAEERATITSFLDRETAKIDALVAEQDRLITLLNEEVDALVLSTLDSDSTREMRLGHAVDVIARPVIQREDETYVPLGLYNRGRGLFHKDPRGQADMGDSDFFWIEPGDLIISGQFAWEGAVALAGEEERGCVVSHRYPVLRGRSGIALTEYVFALLCTRHGDFLLNESSWGAAGRNRPLNLGLLLKEKILVPSMEKQKRIAEAVHNKKRLATEVAIQQQFLQERRSSLISAVVTGQIDVRGLAPAAEPAA